MEKDRGSKIIPSLEDSAVQGLQYRRGSKKLSLNDLNETVVRKPGEFDENNEDSMVEETVPDPPDGGYGWLIVLASFLCNFVLDGISLSHGALMSDIRKASGLLNSKPNYTNFSNSTSFTIDEEELQYNISVGIYSLVGSVLLCVTLSAGPFISILIDRFGFRAVSMSGSILASIGILLSLVISPYTPNIWAFMVFFGILSGFGFGMMFQPSIVIVGVYFERWRPLATGIAISGTGAGIFAFPPLLQQISKTWGWQWAILFLAATSLFSASFALIYRPVPTKRVKVNRKDADAHQRRPSFTGTDVKPFGLTSMLMAMRPLSVSPTFLVISISGGLTMLGFFAPYAFLIDMAKSDTKVDSNSAEWLVSYIGIANTVGRLIFGLISSHPKINSLILSNGALTVAGIATILVPFSTALYELILYGIIFGFGIAIFTVLRSILILKFMGMEKFNNAIGLSLLFMGVGSLLGNTIGGILKDKTGNYSISFYVAGGWLLVSGLMCYPLQHISDWENQRNSKMRESPEQVTRSNSLTL